MRHRFENPHPSQSPRFAATPTAETRYLRLNHSVAWDHRIDGRLLCWIGGGDRAISSSLSWASVFKKTVGVLNPATLGVS